MESGCFVRQNMETPSIKGDIMKVDFFDIMESLFHIHNIEMTLIRIDRLPEESQDVTDIFQKLTIDFSSRQIAELLHQALKPECISVIHTQTMLNYVALTATEELRQEYDFDYIAIGPYLSASLTHEEFLTLLQLLHLSADRYGALQNFYASIPIYGGENDVSSLIALMGKFIYGSFQAFTVENLKDRFTLPSKNFDFTLNKKPLEAMQSVEKRYQAENELLEAVSMGDTNRALYIYGSFTAHRVPPRVTDRLRNAKNLSFSLNTVLRKAVQNGFVHPLYIDEISGKFAQEIEHCSSIETLNALGREMVHRYANLVRNHSMRGYSPAVQKVINYIDFNYQEDLSLKKIASLFSISPSYLSALFRKETGTTLTEYVNSKRIDVSVSLLNTSDFSIQNIAAQVGFLDVNYYTRIFKKQKGLSPSAYRNLVNQRFNH